MQAYALGADGAARDLPPDEGWWCAEEPGPNTVHYVVHKGDTRVATVRYSYPNHKWGIVRADGHFMFLTLDRARRFVIETCEGV